MPTKPEPDPAAAPLTETEHTAAKAGPTAFHQAAPHAGVQAPLVPKADPSPTIPLTPASLAAYKALNAQYEATLQATDDVGVLQAITAAQLEVRNILTKDNMYRIKATTALYDALLTQVNYTNEELTTLRRQIAAVAGTIATGATLLAAIDTVLKVVSIP